MPSLEHLLSYCNILPQGLFQVLCMYFLIQFPITISSNITSSEMPYISNPWRYPFPSISLNSYNFLIKLWYHLSIFVSSVTMETPGEQELCSDLRARKKSGVLPLCKYSMNEWMRKKNLLMKQEAFSLTKAIKYIGSPSFGW